MRLWLALAGLIGLMASARSAWAQPYAQPPDEPRPRAYRAYDDYHVSTYDCYDDGWRRRELGVVRLHVGAAGRATNDAFTPGLMTAIDLGRGPAGFRAAAMWMQVGSDNGLAQYTGELTLDLGGTGNWRPVVGAGAGLARLIRADALGNRVGGGSSLGVGTLRAALEYRLPIEGTDSRAALAVIGVLPAVRGDGAPDTKGWAVITASVGIGF